MDSQNKLKKPLFIVGEVITHRRYGYRGVVVGVDDSCQADEDWWQKNQTQPTRQQPWYHVLVHGSDHTTYVAEENLLNDHSGDPVAHPLINTVFNAFHKGRYYIQSLN